MNSIEAALEAAGRRKDAALGERVTAVEYHSADEVGARSLFLGFDIDMDELSEVAGRASQFFTALCQQNVGLRTLFAACWSDAFLVGLLAAQQAASPTAQAGEGNDALPGEGA